MTGEKPASVKIQLRRELAPYTPSRPALVTSTIAVPASAVRSRRAANWSWISATSSAARSCLPKMSPSRVMLATTPSTRLALSTLRSMVGAIAASSGSAVRERPATITRSGAAALIAS